jgi:cyclomaltodextrinase
VAVVKAGNGYVVGDISGWIRGALREWLGRDSAKLAEVINSYVSLTPPAALPHINTFLENHDLDRATTVFGADGLCPYLLFARRAFGLRRRRMRRKGKKADHTNRRSYTPCPGSFL